jgi:hypothetical protein
LNPLSGISFVFIQQALFKFQNLKQKTTRRDYSFNLSANS